MSIKLESILGLAQTNVVNNINTCFKVEKYILTGKGIISPLEIFTYNNQHYHEHVLNRNRHYEGGLVLSGLKIQ